MILTAVNLTNKFVNVLIIFYRVFFIHSPVSTRTEHIVLCIDIFLLLEVFFYYCNNIIYELCNNRIVITKITPYAMGVAVYHKYTRKLV